MNTNTIQINSHFFSNILFCALAILSAITMIEGGNWLVGEPLLPYYTPHAYKIFIGSIIFLTWYNIRYRDKAFWNFILIYIGEELIYNTTLFATGLNPVAQANVPRFTVFIIVFLFALWRSNPSIHWPNNYKLFSVMIGLWLSSYVMGFILQFPSDAVNTPLATLESIYGLAYFIWPTELLD